MGRPTPTEHLLRYEAMASRHANKYGRESMTKSDYKVRIKYGKLSPKARAATITHRVAQK